MKSLIVSASPRQNGNSALLARSVQEGISESGHDHDLIHTHAVLGSFLNDCRECRQPGGECSINDGFKTAFLDGYLPADGVVLATPVYWYGMAAQLKAFFDRMFCYVAASHPRSPEVIEAMTGKRIGLVLSSEETYPTVAAGIVHQIQEFSRYTRSTFVGVVHGHGNARGDVRDDPRDPLAEARQFGRDFFLAHASDYTIDTPRPARVWH